jgi:phage FluMu protein Com
MNQVLTLAFIPFLISCVIRLYLATTAGVNALDVRTFSEVEISAYSISLMLAGLSFWHVFLRTVCPNCKSYAVSHLRTEELSQYHTVRKVQEKDNNGRSVTRHLNVTVAEMRKHLGCRACNHKWSIDFKRDKK